MSAEKLFKWFKHNQMKGKTCRCHLILFILRTGDSNQIQIENSWIKSSLCENHLGVKFYHQLTFDQDVKSLCRKANAKLRAFARVVRYMGLAKNKLKMSYFFTAHFSYRSLIWMIHSRFNNNKIKNLHKRCLSLIHNKKISSYEEILKKDGLVPIH